ncbi:MAG TPA: FAD-binding and (Fe-S)-binding domain-containing protein [Burkholderiales bacterium]|nr:FAD-binding and (Fe-S)-binding domain-containing protein [Burkholderiales bacterium]
MIPVLRADAAASAPYIDFVAELRLRGFEGDLSATAGDRTVFATDNSIYQVMPQAIAFPRNSTDVVRIAKLASEPRFRSIVITPRGGGTGTNGQSLTEGVVVDLSRHMNRILEINPEERWARVEAGVVKDQLNDAIRQHGLFFAPELSTSNRATIGGMIATDASGQGSVLYGKTRDHVLELECVLLDGTSWNVEPLTRDALEEVKHRDDRVGAVHRVVDRIHSDNADLIAERYPRLNRCVTGYDLVHVRDDRDRFNLNSILCGAEGTLAFVTAAKINLTPIPRHTALISIRYGSFDAALRDARTLIDLEAASIETIDGTVLALARGDAIWLSVEKYLPDDQEGPAQGVNLIELLGNDESALEAKLARVADALDRAPDASTRRGYTIARDERAVLALWSMRKKSVGLLGNMPGEKRPVPFVEDTVVPPEHLADYIAEFRAILDRRGLVYGMFGHVDAGCLHVRPALDMKDPAQEHLVREISDEVFALTRKYGGVLWGEHGKGVRSEYVPEFFGLAYPLLQEIKAAFDPHNQLNPGKIAAPPGHSLLQIDGVPTRGQSDRRIAVAIRDANQDSLHCNGNAACFNYDPDDAMCPSWKATRERRHSPKGRASLMREWLRLLSVAGEDPSLHARHLRQGGSAWTRLPARAWNTWFGKEPDFSHEVKEAMDGCLACKSCAGQCPIKVDVPEFRSRFLELYYGRYLRPLRHRAVAALETHLPRLARVPALFNLLVDSGPGRAALAAIGLVSLPALPRVHFARLLERRQIRTASVDVLASLPQHERQQHVVLVTDAFTLHFEPELVVDFCELLNLLGYVPAVAPYMPNGKPLHVLGLLGPFERTAAKNAAMLTKLASLGVPLIGVDPSLTLTYRAEYAKALGPAHVPEVLLPQEWLASQLHTLPKLASSASASWFLLPHCTERTNAPRATADWQRVCEHFGVELRTLPTGCCGMAGLYGHEAMNRATSEKIYGLSWAEHVRNGRHGGRLLATGYSCRSQVSLIDGIHLQHPIQVLLARMRSGSPSDGRSPIERESDYGTVHHEEY